MCAAGVLLGAFLLFLVQPMVSKRLLPALGGSPAVWTTAMMVFQSLLCLGYGYAHWVAHARRALWAWITHGALLCLAALLAFQVLPGNISSLLGQFSPTVAVLLVLLIHVGLPYWMLSTTSPLLQHVLAQSGAGPSAFRLFALSNLGSFAALLGFPTVLEPTLDLPQMAFGWSWGFVLYALIMLILVTRILSTMSTAPSNSSLVSSLKPSQAPSLWGTFQVAWVALPALASLALVAVTDHVAHAVATEPRLWVTTLAIYLLTFVLTFDHFRWYKPRIYAALSLALLLVALGLNKVLLLVDVPYKLTEQHLRWVYMAWLFCVCMLCHGELVRRRPCDIKHLTAFYWWMSVGGALGGLLVTWVAIPFLNDYYEWPLLWALCVALAWGVLSSLTGPRIAMAAALLTVVLCVQLERNFGATNPDFSIRTVAQARNFYGVVSVSEVTYPNTPQFNNRRFYSGKTLHGVEYSQPPYSQMGTTYYGEGSGVHQTLQVMQKQFPAMRWAMVGLGIGTVAKYARATDTLELFEINPQVMDFADSQFNVLKHTAAVEVRRHLGDARLMLQNAATDAQYDFIFLDAFSGSSVPVHLLTQEAFALYASRLTPEGVLVVHMTNSHLNLYPVIKMQAEALGLSHRLVVQAGSADQVRTPNMHMILTRNPQVLTAIPNQWKPALDAKGQPAGFVNFERPDLRLWTDQYSTLSPLFW